MDSTMMTENPLYLASEAADARGWLNYYDKSCDNALFIEVPSKYKHLTLVVSWSSIADLLMLRIYTPLTFVVPDYATPELYKLLNLFNQNSLVGAWYYEINSHGQPLIMWRQEIPTDHTNLTARQMQGILSTARIAFDTFFPALMSFMGARPKLRALRDGSLTVVSFGTSAEAAARFVDHSTLSGRA